MKPQCYSLDEVLAMRAQAMDLIERARVEGECWVVPKRQVRCWALQRPITVGRLVFVGVCGGKGGPMGVGHRCGNCRCVRPEHLVAGSKPRLHK